MQLTAGRTAAGIEPQALSFNPLGTLGLDTAVSTEAAITLFGILIGASVAVAQLLAARRINQSGIDEMKISAMAPAFLVATGGLLISASVIV